VLPLDPLALLALDEDVAPTDPMEPPMVPCVPPLELPWLPVLEVEVECVPVLPEAPVPVVPDPDVELVALPEDEQPHGARASRDRASKAGRAERMVEP
jgi:hypothetical protein